ncbi:MAG TPA: glycosyltransferase family 4 protein [Candidatus Dormibacteraeota bacterium]|nr:glycosyltransferase family 4 protein [Candidatus Dormibacteraeota bacterium]
MRPPRVTFITHEATRTGAPRVLLTLMRWLKVNSNVEMSTLAVRPGPLLNEFAALGPLVELDGDWRRLHLVQRGLRLANALTADKDASATDSFVNRATGTALWFANIRALDRLGRCDLVYANSVQSGWGVRAIRSQAPVLSHIHELGDSLFAPFERRNVEIMCGDAQEIVVPAQAVRDLLISQLGIAGSRVSVQYPFIDVGAHAPNAAQRRAIRSDLEIPEDAVVVGMSGMLIMRKGADVLVQVAAKVLSAPSARPVYFAWIGGGRDTEYARYLVEDIRRMGLEDRIRLIPEQADASPYLGALDIFMLSSRSDPFPLVCLEAAVQAEAPIVCFADAGGMPELVGSECGVVVPYLDTDAAAAAILGLVDDHDLRKRLGRNAAEAVRTRHDVSRTAPQIAALMNSVMSGRSAGPSARTLPAPEPVQHVVPALLQEGRHANGATSPVHVNQ